MDELIIKQIFIKLYFRIILKIKQISLFNIQGDRPFFIILQTIIGKNAHIHDNRSYLILYIPQIPTFPSRKKIIKVKHKALSKVVQVMTIIQLAAYNMQNAVLQLRSLSDRVYYPVLSCDGPIPLTQDPTAKMETQINSQSKQDQ